MKKGAIIWLTGLAGSGKSHLALNLCEKLREEFDNIIYLDGDELRELLGNFSYDKKGRIEVSKKRSKFAHFLSEQGMIVVVSAISMFEEVYKHNRENLQNYFEIYVKCEFDELLKRDKKMLYSKALKGEIKEVVGVDIKFDEPKAHLVVDNTKLDKTDEKVELILKTFLKKFLK